MLCMRCFYKNKFNIERLDSRQFRASSNFFPFCFLNFIFQLIYFMLLIEQAKAFRFFQVSWVFLLKNLMKFCVRQCSQIDTSNHFSTKWSFTILYASYKILLVNNDVEIRIRYVYYLKRSQHVLIDSMKRCQVMQSSCSYFVVFIFFFSSCFLVFKTTT